MKYSRPSSPRSSITTLPLSKTVVERRWSDTPVVASASASTAWSRLAGCAPAAPGEHVAHRRAQALDPASASQPVAAARAIAGGQPRGVQPRVLHRPLHLPRAGQGANGLDRLQEQLSGPERRRHGLRRGHASSGHRDRHHAALPERGHGPAHVAVVGQALGVVEHRVDASVAGQRVPGVLAADRVSALAENLGQGGVTVAVHARRPLGKHGPHPALAMDDAHVYSLRTSSPAEEPARRAATRLASESSE